MVPRVVTLAACCWLMLTVGCMYAFSAFSGRLAELMDFDDTELNAIGVAYNLGTWFGVIGGLVCDRFGVVHATRWGAALLVCGSVGSALAVARWIPHGSVSFASLAFLFSQGSGWSYLSGMKAALKAFHEADHGAIVGTLVCFVALSSGFMSQTYKCLLDELPLVAYYLLVGFLCAVLQVSATFFFQPDEKLAATGQGSDGATPLTDNERGALRRLSMVGVALSMWILLCSLLESRGHTTSTARAGLWFGMLALVATLPMWAYRWATGTSLASGAFQSVRLEDEAAVVAGTAPTTVVGAETAVAAASCEQLGGEMTSRPSLPSSTPQSPPPAVAERRWLRASEEQTMCAQEASQSSGSVLARATQTMDFWFLIASIAFALSFPVTHLNNLTPLTMSFQTEISPSEVVPPSRVALVEVDIASNVAFFSVGNAWGRLFSGYLADRHSGGQPRWLWFTVAVGVELLANLALLTFYDRSVLVVSISLAGFGLGSIFSIAPIATADIYGRSNFATMWGALTIAPCITTELLGTLLAGGLADRAARSSSFTTHEHHYCLGSSCFYTTFVVTLLVELAALVTTLVLLRRLQQRRASIGTEPQQGHTATCASVSSPMESTPAAASFARDGTEETQPTEEPGKAP